LGCVSGHFSGVYRNFRGSFSYDLRHTAKE
jgi:hypothetical protein